MTHIQKFFTFLFTALTINCWASTVTAQSWLIANEDGKILSGENTKEIRSIASITKLMTAMVILDAKQNMNELKPYISGKIALYNHIIIPLATKIPTIYPINL